MHNSVQIVIIFYFRKVFLSKIPWWGSLWICRNLLIYILLPAWNEELVDIAEYFRTPMYSISEFFAEREEILFSQAHTLHQLASKYRTRSCLGFWAGEESTPSLNESMRNAGCSSFVSSMDSQRAGEVESWEAKGMRSLRS